VNDDLSTIERSFAERLGLAMQVIFRRSAPRSNPAAMVLPRLLVTLIHGPDAPSMIELPIIPRDHLTW